MIIDTHGHAYPTVASQLRRVPLQSARRLADLLDLLPNGPIWGSRSNASPPKSVRLGIQELSLARSLGPPKLLQWMEQMIAVAALPQTVLVQGTLPRLLDSMGRHKVDRTALIAVPPLAPNLWVLEEATSQPDGQLIPVVTAPSLGKNAPIQEWIDGFQALVKGGAKGFKIHPNMEGLPPEHPSRRAAFEVAKAHDLPIILHTGLFHVPIYRDKAASDPMAYEDYYKEYPQVRVCLAHMNREDPWRAWEAMRRHGQLYCDTSWQPAEIVRGALASVGKDRILLGSDWPLMHPQLQGDVLGILRRSATDSVVEAICAENALRFFGGDEDKIIS